MPFVKRIIFVQRFVDTAYSKNKFLCNNGSPPSNCNSKLLSVSSTIRLKVSNKSVIAWLRIHTTKRTLYITFICYVYIQSFPFFHFVSSQTIFVLLLSYFVLFKSIFVFFFSDFVLLKSIFV